MVALAEGDEDININGGGYDNGDYDPAKLREVHQALISLITTCVEVAFEIVQGVVSPSKALSRFVQHYRASDFRGRRGPTTL